MCDTKILFKSDKNHWLYQLYQALQYIFWETFLIVILIKEHRCELPLEFILEELTKLGLSPNLVYDDNGNFAITDDSMNEVHFEPSDTNVFCFVKKECWKSTIRESLNYYLDNE